jgi:hypothetical protein
MTMTTNANTKTNAKTNAKTTTQKTASQAYAAAKGDIARLLDVLQMELDALAKRAALAQRHWGYAGDLGRIRDGLIELVMAMSGMDRDAVAGFLDDANACDGDSNYTLMTRGDGTQVKVSVPTDED